MGNKRLWAAMQEKEQLLALADITDEQGASPRRARVHHRRGGRLHRRVRRGRAARRPRHPRAASIEKPMRELAGGLKLRVLLAQALFGKPEALLLDEPTNNLDLDSIRWLEGFLCELRGRAGHHLARSPLPQRDLHAHRRHRLRDHHHLHRRLRRHGDGQEPGARRASSRRTPTGRRRSRSCRTSSRASRAGTRASQVQSRKKQIEKLQLSDLKQLEHRAAVHPAPGRSGRRASRRSPSRG